MDVVKFAEATAWPLASVVIALVLLLVIRMIITKSGKMGFSIKDWMKFEADASKQISEKVTVPEPELAKPAVEVLLPVGESGAEPKAPVADHTDHSIGQMIEATTLADLNRAFDDFKAVVDPETDQDFWTTYYVEKKRELGSSGAAEELRALADANPSWAGPLLSLLRSAIATHDLDAAQSLIQQALARRNKDNASTILQTVLHAYYRLISPDRALEFYQEMVSMGATSTERTSMLVGLAANLDKSTQTFGYRTATEMSLLVDPGRSGDRFSLAFSYAEDVRTWAPAFILYCDIDAKSEQYAWSLNNRGVLMQSQDKAISIDYYARGMAARNALASSNLARQLINDGYYALGERILDEIKEPEDAAEHIATSRAAALSGRRAMDKRLDAIVDFSRDETRRYNAILARALRSIDRTDPPPKGVFGTVDRSVLVLFDNAGAAFRVTIGTLIFEGVLQNSVLGYSGFLTAKGQGLLGATMSVSLYVTGKDEVSVITWPSTQSLTDRIRTSELRRLEPTPNVALDQPTAVPQITGDSA
jgi:hypothetical protein